MALRKGIVLTNLEKIFDAIRPLLTYEESEAIEVEIVSNTPDVAGLLFRKLETDLSAYVHYFERTREDGGIGRVFVLNLSRGSNTWQSFHTMPENEERYKVPLTEGANVYQVATLIVDFFKTGEFNLSLYERYKDVPE